MASSSFCYYFFLLRCDLFLHLLDHDRQLFFAFFTGFGVDIARDPLAVGISGGLFALPEVVVKLVDAAGACCVVFTLIWLEIALFVVWCLQPTTDQV